MTDEELKELAKLECAKLLKSEKGYNGLSFQEFWEEGMKYGLAEGRKEKWHDLREDPNDLPTATGQYLTTYDEICIYDADCKRWRTLKCLVCGDFGWFAVGDIIAWCELPKFEE